MEIYNKFIIELNKELKSLCVDINPTNDDELVAMYNYAMLSGRRYRPMLLLTGKLIGDLDFDESTLLLATAIELMHKYSLILDDYVDNDPLRRGTPTFYHKYGKDNAQAMSAYLMNLLFRQKTRIYNCFKNDCRLTTILEYMDDIMSDMSVGFMSDLNPKSRDIRGVRKISDMQTTTLLRNSLILGFIISDGYIEKDNGYLLNELFKLGNSIGTVFQAYNDIEIFCGSKFQMANKGQEFSDIIHNRKNIVLAKVPLRIIGKRETSDLIDYINSNHLLAEVFEEINDELIEVEKCLNKLPPASSASKFLKLFLHEKREVLMKMSKEDILNYNDVKNIGVI